MSRRAVGPSPKARQTMPRGVNPNVWGMEEISSSCELILRTLVIDDHLLNWRGTFLRKSNRPRGGSDSGALPIWGRCRPGLAGASTGIHRDGPDASWFS